MLAIDDDAVVPLVDRLAEVGAQLDEAVHQRLDALALLLRQLEAVAAIVAQGVVEQPLRFAGQAVGFGRFGELP